MKSLVPNLETKNLEAQNFIMSLRKIMRERERERERERIDKFMRKLFFSIGVFWGGDEGLYL